MVGEEDMLDFAYRKKCLGQYTIEQIQSQPNGTPSNIKVKVRLNRNGIFDVKEAFIFDPTEDSKGRKDLSLGKTHIEILFEKKNRSIPNLKANIIRKKTFPNLWKKLVLFDFSPIFT